MREKLKAVGIGLIALIAVVSMVGGASAGEIDSRTVTLDSPDQETIEVDLDATGSAEVAVELVKDGSVVKDQNVSVVSGDTPTVSMSAAGLASGEVTLQLRTADADTGNVSISDSRMVITQQNEHTVPSGNDSTDIVTDVEFSATELSTATVELLDADTGGSLATDNLSFDPVDYEGGTGLNSSTLTVNQSSSDSINTTVKTTVSPVESYQAVYSETDSSLFGSFAGIESDTRLIVLAGVIGVGLLYGRSRDMI